MTTPDGRFPWRPILVGAVIVLLLLVVVPSLLRSRVQRPESDSIHLIRTVIAAESVYHRSSGGWYGTPGCLARPADCIPDYDASGPPLLGSAELKLLVDGSVLTFHGWPARAEPEHPKHALDGYAVVAAPVAGDGSQPSFCGDHTGQICIVSDGPMPAIQDGQCPADCRSLQ